MKVLVLMPDKAKRFSNALYASLRVRVGTCDVYHLKEGQFDQVEEFFRNFIRLEQYDRIVVAAPPSYILRKIKVFRNIAQLVVLRLDYDSEAENVQMAKVFTQMPWVRWIGIDDEICEEFGRHGWDAYWIPSAYDAEWFHHNRLVRETPLVHVYDPGKKLVAALETLSAVAMQHVPVDADDHYMGEAIKPQDIFLFHPHWAYYEPNRLIHAMANGAVVILPALTLKRRVLFGWHDFQDCIFYSDIAAVPELLKKALGDAELRENISAHAVDKVMLFHPKEVGQRLGARLEISPRSPKEYPGPRRIFGIELGW